MLVQPSRFFGCLRGFSTNPELLNAFGLVKSDAFPDKLYAKVIIAGKCFTVTKNDTVMIHRLLNTNVADVIQLERCLELGSPSYTLRNERNFLDPSLFSIQATVLSHTRGQKVHRKIVYRRKVQLPTKNFKPLITILRIRDISIRIPQEK